MTRGIKYGIRRLEVMEVMSLCIYSPPPMETGCCPEILIRLCREIKVRIVKVQVDYWIVKIDNQGNKLWDKTLGGNYLQILWAAILTPDGSYLLAGSSMSDASGDKSENSKGFWDYWVVKIDAGGNKVWDKTLGGNRSESAFSGLTRLTEVIFWVAVLILMLPETKVKIAKALDYWVVKFDADGNKVWDKTIGGTDIDNLYSTILTPDGRYLLTGILVQMLLEIKVRIVKVPLIIGSLNLRSQHKYVWQIWWANLMQPQLNFIGIPIPQRNDKRIPCKKNGIAVEVRLERMDTLPTLD